MFRNWFRQNGFARSPVDRETQDAILEAERVRVERWVAKRMFSSNIEVDDGCGRLLPEGVTITVRVRGVDRAALAPLLDDIDLDGSLRRVFVDPERVQLVFIPLRSTDVYDIALRRLEELLRNANQPPPNDSSQGPYR
jgi:hypothetical protein